MHGERTPFRLERNVNVIGEVETVHDAMDLLANEFLDPKEALLWEFKLMVFALEVAYQAGLTAGRRENKP